MDGVGNVGHPGLCGDTEYKTHFALWCMMGSPLMIGSDLRRVRPETVELLKNPHLLRINQDPECRNPIVIESPRSAASYMMFKHLSNNRVALGFFNLNDDNGSGELCPHDIGLSINCGFGLKLTEVFTGETIDYVDDYLRIPIKAHDCKVYIGEYVTRD